jgi:hypothetical protein
MSFSSAERFLRDMGVTNETATDEQRKSALLSAFRNELPRGFSFLEKLATRAKNENKPVMELDGYDDELVAQLTRLTGHTVPRELLEEEFGVGLGSYNCHYPVASPPGTKPKLSLKMQIDLQNGQLASVDC